MHAAKPAPGTAERTQGTVRKGFHVTSSSAFSDPSQRSPAAGSVAGRPSSDRLSLSGHPAPGVVDYRSTFVQLWAVGGEVSAEEIRSGVGDLEQAARAAAFAALAQGGPDLGDDGSPTLEPGGLPLPVRQFLAGLGFLRDHLWAGSESDPPALAGFLLHEGRLWALRAGIEVRLDQMTGAPVRVPWHETPDGPSLAWGEAEAREVWRLECAGPAGVLAVHARPALTSVLGTMRDEAMSDSSTPIGPALQVVAARPPAARASRATTRPAAAALLQAWRLRPQATLVAVACLAVAGLAGLAIWAREPVSRALVGRYDLALVTRPAGATVRVDGKLVAGRTPLTLPLEPGEHRVELGYGEYAHAVITVDGSRDETVRREFTWMGSLAVSSADTTARLRVTLDGKPLGTLPLWRDEVEVGRHRLSFQGTGVRPWEEEVKIKVGQSTRVLAEPVRVPDYGLVTARAERVSSDGVEDVEGASVFVDGKAAGATPLDLRLSPGPHSVRVASGPELGPVHLIDVQAGGRFYASTTFGRPAEPAVAFEAPRAIARATPPRLAVRLHSDVPLPVRRMRLFTRAPGSERFAAADLAIARDGGGSPRGTIAFPVAGLAAGATVRYYVSIETREGEEYFSEVRTAVVTP